MQEYKEYINMTKSLKKELPSILILGGTTEAYQLAEILEKQPVKVITSLAGRTSSPRTPKGSWRIGGFGGIEGLLTYILKEKITLIVDATHPFARQMTDHAYEASRIAQIPLIRLERPLWQQQEKDLWVSVSNIDEAISAIPKGTNILLALGRQHIAPFKKVKDAKFIARMLEYPDHIEDYKHIEFIIGLPNNLTQEKDLLINKKIDCIICRNSGGDTSYTKVRAARELAVPVIMIERMPLPNVITLHSINDVLDYLTRMSCLANIKA